MPNVLNNSYMRIKLANSGENDPVPTIRPGTVLYGEVECKSTNSERLGALTVCLLGKLVVKAKGRREVTQIFGVQHPILTNDDEPIELEARVQRFPFHFVVPWTTEYDRVGTFKDDPRQMFVESQHRVPPSLGSKSKDARVCYSCYAVGRTKSTRLGGLVPTMDFPSGEELEDIRCLVELPDVGQEPPISVQQELSPPTQRVSGGLFRRSSTVAMENMSESLGKCALTLSCPSLAVPGEKVVLTATIEHRDQASTGVDNKSWTIAIKSVDLLTRTSRRIKDLADPFVDEKEAKILQLQKPTPVKEGVGGKIEVRVEARDTIPSFRSYTISHTHAFRVTILSLLGGGSARDSTQELVTVELPVEIVRRRDVPLRNSLTSQAHEMDGQQPEALPPAYEDSPMYQV